MHEALRQGLIQPHVVAQAGDLLGRGVLPGQHDLGRIARCRGHHKERDDGDAQQHRDQVKKPAKDHFTQASRRFSRPSGLGVNPVNRAETP